jgi:hypothetical protein
MISFILEKFGDDIMKNILLFITILLTVILVSCADLEDKAGSTKCA